MPWSKVRYILCALIYIYIEREIEIYIYIYTHPHRIRTEINSILLFFPRADFFEDEAIQHILKYKPWWVDAHKKMMALQGESQNHGSHTLGENTIDLY